MQKLFAHELHPPCQSCLPVTMSHPIMQERWSWHAGSKQNAWAPEYNNPSHTCSKPHISPLRMRLQATEMIFRDIFLIFFGRMDGIHFVQPVPLWWNYTSMCHNHGGNMNSCLKPLLCAHQQKALSATKPALLTERSGKSKKAAISNMLLTLRMSSRGHWSQRYLCKSEHNGSQSQYSTGDIKDLWEV